MENNQYTERKNRVDTASRLSIPDRVPFVPLTGMYAATAYGVDPYDIMIDPRNAIPAVGRFLTDLQPDAALHPIGYCIPTMEIAQATFIKWPGPTFGLPKGSSFQVPDNTFLEEDEYDEFLRDPSHFQMTKLFPRKFAALGALSKLSFQNLAQAGSFDALGAFAQDDVKKALFEAIRAAEAYEEYNRQTGEVIDTIVQSGYPMMFDMVSITPFDMFADDYRGLINAVMDIKIYPEKVMAVVDYLTEVLLGETIAFIGKHHPSRCFIALHAGTDEFMSGDDYVAFYWKGLKRLLETLIEHDVTPVVFCEGNYDTRLDFLCDVPRGKVEYMFEKVDIATAKKTVGKVACIHGNMPSSLLAFGSAKEVADKTKQLIDDAAYDGGFMMNVSIALDNAKPENMEIWRDTTWEYGKY